MRKIVFTLTLHERFYQAIRSKKIILSLSLMRSPALSEEAKYSCLIKKSRTETNTQPNGVEKNKKTILSTEISMQTCLKKKMFLKLLMVLTVKITRMTQMQCD